MRTGMLEPTNMEILWKLQLVDYALNRTGNELYLIAKITII